jgi:hypothetical protein
VVKEGNDADAPSGGWCRAAHCSDVQAVRRERRFPAPGPGLTHSAGLSHGTWQQAVSDRRGGVLPVTTHYWRT